MAAPTAPTLTNIVAEALKKAGYASPATALVDRAEDFWMEEIKSDIVDKNPDLRYMMAETTDITINGQSKYPMPTDFGIDMTMQILDGANTGTAQAGGATSITLAATDSFTAGFILGKRILIYSGTGEDGLRQIIAYNDTTKVATVDAAWATNPDATSKYMIVDTYYPLNPLHVKTYAAENYPTRQGRPDKFVPIGDDDNGEYILYPVPYRASTIPYGVYLRYQADLLRLDLAATRMVTIYRHFRNVFDQGIYAKALKNKQDKQADMEMQRYQQMLALKSIREKYGNDLSGLQMTVG